MKHNKRVTIGIITYQTEYSDYSEADSFIMESHLRWMKMLNIRVLPIPYDTPSEDIESFICQVDGLYLPSSYLGVHGSSHVDIHGKTTNSESHVIAYIKRFIDIAIKRNRDGIYFPIFGICRGSQYMMIIQSGDDELIEEFDSFNGYKTPFKFGNITNAPTKKQADALMQEGATHNHAHGLSPGKFEQYKSLTSFYDIITTDKDRNGKEFISIIKSKQYPFYGIIWHPESSKQSSKFVGKFMVKELQKNLSKKCNIKTPTMKYKRVKSIKNNLDVTARYYTHKNRHI